MLFSSKDDSVEFRLDFSEMIWRIYSPSHIWGNHACCIDKTEVQLENNFFQMKVKSNIKT